MVVDLLTKGKKGVGYFIDGVKQKKDGYFKLSKTPIEVPYPFSRGCSVVYNNEIHIFGSEGNPIWEIYEDEIKYYHYKFNGQQWIKLDNMPNQYYYGLSYSKGTLNTPAVVYNNKILIGLCAEGGSPCYLYEWDGEIWKKSDIPFIDNDSDQINFVYNGVLHAMTSNDNGKYAHHYYYNGEEWISLSDVPNPGTGFSPSTGFSICIYNNKIHYFASKNIHYECGSDGEWVTSFNVSVNDSEEVIAVNNKLYKFVLGKANNNENDFSYLSNNDFCFYTKIPYMLPNAFNVVAYNNKIYFIGGGRGNYKEGSYEAYNFDRCMYELDLNDTPNKILFNPKDYVFGYYPELDIKYFFSFNNELYLITGYVDSYSEDEDISDGFFKVFEPNKSPNFERISSAPSFDICQIVIFNNAIHALSNDTLYKFNFDILDWEEVSFLPYNFNKAGSAIVLNNEIHILGGLNGSSRIRHYKFNGSRWVSVSTLPYEFSNNIFVYAVVYRNKIHIFGKYIWERSSDEGFQESSPHYKWNGLTWEKLEDLPLELSRHPILVYDDKIHFFGLGTANGHIDSCSPIEDYNASQIHYRWNDENGYEQFAYCPTDFEYFSMYCDYPAFIAEQNKDIYVIPVWDHSGTYYKLPASVYEEVTQPGIKLANFVKTIPQIYTKV